MDRVSVVVGIESRQNMGLNKQRTQVMVVVLTLPRVRRDHVQESCWYRGLTPIYSVLLEETDVCSIRWPFLIGSQHNSRNCKEQSLIHSIGDERRNFPYMTRVIYLGTLNVRVRGRRDGRHCEDGADS